MKPWGASTVPPIGRPSDAENRHATARGAPIRSVTRSQLTSRALGRKTGPRSEVSERHCSRMLSKQTWMGTSTCPLPRPVVAKHLPRPVHLRSRSLTPVGGGWAPTARDVPTSRRSQPELAARCVRRHDSDNADLCEHKEQTDA